MIRFENTEVFNFEGALRGMRNPLNSWDKSDSFECNGENCLTSYCPYDYVTMTFTEDDGECLKPDNVTYIIGKNDLNLAQRLIKAGSDDRKFLRQIFVSVDITAPLYFFKEFDTYKISTVANSTSTMHKIHAKEFTLDDFSHEHLIDDSDEDYQYENPIYVLEYTIGALNHHRERFLETKDKKHWWQMIQLLPSSYNQKRTITLNYENLRNMYRARKGHKLDEWRVGFMEWIDSLPYAEELIKYETISD